MFDELFPGMGMAGMYGMMDPSMFAGMQQYKQPGADIFSDIGLMSPQQQMFQSVELQNMMQQQQLARQQQMLALRNMSQNIGVNAAQAGTGFAGPMLMQMGGLQPSWGPGLTSGLNQAIDMYANRGQQQNGMMPQAAPSSDVDPARIVDDSIRASGGDPAKGYKMAADTLSQLADSTGNDNYRMSAARLRAQAFALQQKEAESSASTQKNQADAAEARARAKSVGAEMYMPKPLGVVHDQSGQVGLAYSQIDPSTGKPSIKTTGWGVPIQYVIPNTPNGMESNIRNFQDTVTNGLDSMQRINGLENLLKSKGGAAQGWAADGVDFANNLLGTLRQLAPGTTLDAGAEAALGKYNGTFQQWANKTAISQSLWSDLTMGLAGVYAHGQRISNVDIKRAADTLGESQSNPESITQILDSVKSRMSQHIDNEAETYLIGGNPQYKGQITGLQAMFHRKVGALGAAPTYTPPAPQGGSAAPISLDDYLKSKGY